MKFGLDTLLSFAFLSFFAFSLVAGTSEAKWKKHSTQKPQLASASSNPRTLPSSQINQTRLQDEIRQKPIHHDFAVVGEILGRGGIYSINGEFSPMREVTLGAGFSYYNARYGLAEATLMTFPIYAHGYFYDFAPRHRTMVSGGVTIVNLQLKSTAATINLKGGSEELDIFFDGQELVNATLPFANLGGGYEYRHEGGFLFRAQALVFYTEKLQPFFGSSVGYAF